MPRLNRLNDFKVPVQRICRCLRACNAAVIKIRDLFILHVMIFLSICKSLYFKSNGQAQPFSSKKFKQLRLLFFFFLFFSFLNCTVFHLAIIEMCCKIAVRSCSMLMVIFMHIAETPKIHIIKYSSLKFQLMQALCMNTNT